MSEHDKFHEDTESNDAVSRILPKAGVAVLVIIAGIAIAYGYHQQSVVNDMTARDSALNASVMHLQSQLDSTTAKLNDMAAQAAAAQAQAAQAAQTTATSKRKTASASDKRIKALQARLDEQQKALTDTNNAIARTRSDLQGSLDSTRTDLNGAIAKNHDELVALEKRGQRDYFEFDIAKSRQFTRTGPISLSLRKADTKHLHYDLAMLVDDNRMMKKNVNLYEPVWLNREDDPQPVQIVVNKISKDTIHGYVSAPKFRKSELAATATTPALTPVAATAPPPSQAPDSSTAPAPPAGPQNAPGQP